MQKFSTKKYLINQIHLKRIIHHNSVGVILKMQIRLNLQKIINVLHYINRTKDKNPIIISTDAKIAFDKINMVS